MKGTEKINTALNSNQNMYQQMIHPSVSSNKAHLVNGYYSDKIHYYNDEVALKKEKKKKNNKLLILLFSGISLLSIAGTAIYQMARNKVNYQDNLSMAKSQFDKFVNLFMNLDMSKNDLWTRGSKKVSGSSPVNVEKWFDNPIKKFYSFLGKYFNEKKYNHSINTIKDYQSGLGISKLPEDYSLWFNRTGDEIASRVHQKGRRVNDIMFAGFKKQTGDTFSTRMKRGFSVMWEEGTKDVIADRTIGDIYVRAEKGISDILPYDLQPSKIIAQANIDKHATKAEIHKAYVEAIKKRITSNPSAFNVDINDEKAVNSLATKLSDSIIQLNKVTTVGAREVIEKQRDIHLGNQSVEVASDILTTGGLALAIASSDTKEERKSRMLNIGIPLGSALAFSSVGGMLNIAGWKGAVTGLAVGEIAKAGAKAVDKVGNDIKHLKPTDDQIKA